MVLTVNDDRESDEGEGEAGKSVDVLEQDSGSILKARDASRCGKRVGDMCIMVEDEVAFE